MFAHQLDRGLQKPLARTPPQLFIDRGAARGHAVTPALTGCQPTILNATGPADARACPGLPSVRGDAGDRLGGRRALSGTSGTRGPHPFRTRLAQRPARLCRGHGRRAEEAGGHGTGPTDPGQDPERVEGERKLRESLASGEIGGATERRQLGEPERGLDQCRDLLHRRGAESESGENPDDARVRPSSQVGDYRC
ncbi:DUF2630 family protein [Streptomyces sp. NPDC001508]|uniref:DUF2630 family protein n=1 Tax=Streptomyces sp. NPDC001508 TaxID=3154656 RepID=UPI00331F5381